MKNNDSKQITESDIKAFLVSKRNEFAHLFPEIDDLALAMNTHKESVNFSGTLSASEKWRHCFGAGHSIESAADKFREDIGVRGTAADRLRAAAAKLLKEADKAEGAQ